MNAPFALRRFSDATAVVPFAEDGWFRLECRAVINETPDVKTFMLAPVSGGRLSFEPGQFLTLRAIVAGRAIERCYTLSSSAAVDGAVEITVKRKPGGAMANHLHDTLALGDTIDAFGPAGQFGVPEADARKLLLLSAGSGVTPMMAILRTAADLGCDLDVVHLDQIRTPSDRIFTGEDHRFARRLRAFRGVTLASLPDAGWAGEAGRIDAGRLVQLVPDIAERNVLCCGPQGFMTAMRDAAAAAGVPSNRYFEESFDFGVGEPEPVFEAPAADNANEPVAALAHTVSFARSGKTFQVPAGQTVLQAAKAAGLPMPSSCGKGACGTCKCRKVDGAVAMVNGGGLRQREIDKGMILPCTSRPESDLVLDR